MRPPLVKDWPDRAFFIPASFNNVAVRLLFDGRCRSLRRFGESQANSRTTNADLDDAVSPKTRIRVLLLEGVNDSAARLTGTRFIHVHRNVPA